MRIVLGYERLTVTCASAAVTLTLREIRRVSTFANGVPIRTAARSMMAETSPGGTPSTLTDLVTITGLNSTNHSPPASRARTTASHPATNQGRRRTRAARASNLAREDRNPEERRAEVARGRSRLPRLPCGLKPGPVPGGRLGLTQQTQDLRTDHGDVT